MRLVVAGRLNRQIAADLVPAFLSFPHGTDLPLYSIAGHLSGGHIARYLIAPSEKVCEASVRNLI